MIENIIQFSVRMFSSYYFAGGILFGALWVFFIEWVVRKKQDYDMAKYYEDWDELYQFEENEEVVNVSK